LLCGLLFSAVAFGAGINRLLPTGDIIELTSPQVALTPEEQQTLADGGIGYVAVPLGILGEGTPLEIMNSLQAGIVVKFIVPEGKRGLLQDSGFRKRFTTALKDMIVKAGAAQTQIRAVLLQFEGGKPADDFKGAADFAASLHPLNISLGAGVPSFWISKKLERDMEGFDFAVLFEQGFAYPPSLNPALIDSYRGQTKENTPGSVEMPHFVAFSLASAAWVTRADGGREVWPAMDIGLLTHGAGITSSTQILDNFLVDPQYAFDFRRTLALGHRQVSKGDKLTLALTSYPFRRDTMGGLSRRVHPGLLGRYLAPYSSQTENGVIGLSALKAYLGGAIDGPLPKVDLIPSGGGRAIVLTNTSGLYSDLSTSGNYVEWAAPQGRIRDASVGEFQRFRFMSGEEEEVPARATAIRFYLAYFAPYDSVRSGNIAFSGPVTGTLRVHLTLPGGEVLKFKFPVQ
jgi:hypothetical protein